MRVLVACERSQAITAAFRAKGHDAFSCDFAPAAVNPAWHIRGDARAALNDGWDLLIAHPPCTKLANSGVQWVKKRRAWEEVKAAADLFLTFWNAPIPGVVVENPVPHSYAVEEIGRRYNQIVQPHFFGEPQFKATCLWLRGVPELKRTHHLPLPYPGTPEFVAWSACHRAGDTPNRAANRAVTLPGVAAAMAEQWGAYG